MEVYGFCDRICRTKKGNNFFLLAGDVTLKRILPSPAYTLISVQTARRMHFSAHGVTTILFTRASPAAAQVRSSGWRQIGQLERDLGLALHLESAVNELKIGGLLLEREQSVIVFCNPMLLEETLHSLTNKAYIKLCGDGTFRLTQEDWVFMTVGVLSKHYSESEGVYAFRTNFHPLIFALANKESQVTYQ